MASFPSPSAFGILKVMSQSFVARICRIVAPEKLTDRFLASGIFTQQEGFLLNNQVILIYIFEINKPWFPSSKVLPSLIHTLREQFKDLKPGATLGDQFESLLKSINETLNLISEQGETDWIGNLNGLIMLLSGEELHFSQTGYCPAYLLQNNRIRQITDDGNSEHDPHPLKTFSNLASGVLKEEDRILVANHELYQEISLDALRRIIHSSSPYQASLAIAKQLRKDKNAAITSAIIHLHPPLPAEKPSLSEPTEVILEEEMRSNLKKFQQKMRPFIQKTKKFSLAAGKAGLEAAKKTHYLVKTKVAPQAAALLGKGTQQAKQLSAQLVGQINQKEGSSETETTVEVISDLPTEKPVVELILPKEEREKRRQEEIVKQAESQIQKKFSPEPDINIEPNTLAPDFLTRLSAYAQSLKGWHRSPRNRKIAALGLAAFLLTGTIWSAISKKQPTEVIQNQSQNNQLLKEIASLNERIAAAIELKQDIEASHKIEEAQNALNALKNLSDSQRTTADKLWTELNTRADTLSKTTRLTAPFTTYSFSSASSGMISSLPFFYGFGSGVPGLLRAGQGDIRQTQKTIELSSPEDKIVSLAKSSESNTAGFVFTKQSKMYRIVPSNNETLLQEVTPISGSFAPGDVVISYAGNLYILDGKSGLLWKYANTGTTYANGVNMLDINKYNIRKSVSLAIDGSLYILKQDGTLQKFTSGQPETNFVLKDIPEIAQKMLQPLQIITDEDLTSLFILDAGLTSSEHSTARVMEFKKDGTFIRQYGFPKEYTKVSAFDINPQEKKLWILNGSQISEFNL